MTGCIKFSKRFVTIDDELFTVHYIYKIYIYIYIYMVNIEQTKEI